MTKDEALRLALEALKFDSFYGTGKQEAITAIKAALEAKDEPVKLRRGDILRCIETDELCTVWATSSSGKTLVKWKGNDFGSYTAEQIGELFWIEPKEKDEPWEKFCDSNCVWTDHHPDCKLAKDEPVAWISPTELLVMRGNALGGAKDWRVNVGLKPEDGDVGLYTTPPQRTWVGLMRGVRVDGDTVVISVKGGNDEARELCGALLMEKNT
jgi:hypothetical protein